MRLSPQEFETLCKSRPELKRQLVQNVKSDAPYSLDVTIDELPSINSARRLHWSHSYKERKRWAWLVAHAIRGQVPPEPLSRARFSLTRYSDSLPDYGNLVESGKIVLDQFVRQGVLIDDSPRHLEEHYRWRLSEGKGIRVEVEEVESLGANVRRFGE